MHQRKCVMRARGAFIFVAGSGWRRGRFIRRFDRAGRATFQKAADTGKPEYANDCIVDSIRLLPDTTTERDNRAWTTSNPERCV